MAALAVHSSVRARPWQPVFGRLTPAAVRSISAIVTEFKLNYLAPVKGGTLVAESTAVSLGRRAAVVRVEVSNGDQLACVVQGRSVVSEPPKKPEV